MRDEIVRTLRELQWALRVDAALTTFSRVCFFSMLALCIIAITLKMLGGSLSGFVVISVVLLAAAVSIPRMLRYSLRRSAVVAERRLGLDERLSTCLENLDAPPSPVIEEQRWDTLRALKRSDLDEVKRLHSPRELFYAGAFTLVLTVILLAPNPVKSETPPRANREVSREAGLQQRKLQEEQEVRTLRGRKALHRLREILDGLSGDSGAAQVREGLKALADLRRGIENELDGPGLSMEEKKELEGILQFLQSAGAALARRVDPAEIPEELLAPRRETTRKIREWTRNAQVRTSGPERAFPSGPVDDPGAPGGGRWDRRFDPIVRRFFGEER